MMLLTFCRKIVFPAFERTCNNQICVCNMILSSLLSNRSIIFLTVIWSTPASAASTLKIMRNIFSFNCASQRKKQTDNKCTFVARIRPDTPIISSSSIVSPIIVSSIIISASSTSTTRPWTSTVWFTRIWHFILFVKQKWWENKVSFFNFLLIRLL